MVNVEIDSKIKDQISIMALPSNTANKAEAFKNEVEGKIQKLIEEFSDGKISKEQFHAIYERYTQQLAIANQAMLSGNNKGVADAQTGPGTIAMRNALMGKALGMVIYHHKSGTILETLGDFDVAVTKISSTLNDFTMLLDSGKLLEAKTQKIEEQQWILFTPGTFTTIVTLFRNEPSKMQSQELKRLHHDFENANQNIISKEVVDKDKLGYPFVVIIRQRFKK